MLTKLYKKFEESKIGDYVRDNPITSLVVASLVLLFEVNLLLKNYGLKFSNELSSVFNVLASFISNLYSPDHRKFFPFVVIPSNEIPFSLRNSNWVSGKSVPFMEIIPG